MAKSIGEGLTFEKVWAMMQETDRQLKENMKETDRQMKESDQRLKERMEETDRKIKEVSRIVGDLCNKFGKLSEYLVVPNTIDKFNALGYEVAKTCQDIELRGPDKKILTEQETDRQLKESMKETDRKIKEVSEEMKETDRALKEASRIVGALCNNFGKLSEYQVVPNMVDKFTALGYEVAKSCQDIELRGPDKKFLTGIDILLENDDSAIVIEVKSDLLEEHVQQHAQRMEKLRGYWDAHNDTRKLIGAVAGAIMAEQVKTYALNMGFYVIVQSGDTVKIEAPEGFTPRIW